MMDNKLKLSKYFDCLVNGDAESAKDAFSSYMKGKVSAITNLKEQSTVEMVVSGDTEYTIAGHKKITIPAGTPVEYASNQPDGGWWVKEWQGMSPLEDSHMRNYGFLLSDDDVVDASEFFGGNYRPGEDEEFHDRINYMNDMSDDGDALASAGFGTDEDYGHFGGDDF